MNIETRRFIWGLIIIGISFWVEVLSFGAIFNDPKNYFNYVMVIIGIIGVARGQHIINKTL